MRRGLGGAFGGYFGMTFIAMCIVLAVVYKRHQANLVRWRAMRAAQASGNGAALLAPQEGACSQPSVVLHSASQAHKRVTFSLL